MDQKKDVKSVNFQDFAKTVLILFSVTLVSLMLNRLQFLDSNLIMVFIFGVVLVSVGTNRIFGLIASLSSVVIFNFLFTDPKYTFAVADSQYIFTLIIMLAVALIISTLTVKEKNLAREAEKRELRTNILLNMSRSLLTLNGRENICREALNQLQNAVNGFPAIELLNPGSFEGRTFLTGNELNAHLPEGISGDNEILKLRIQGAEILHGYLFIYTDANHFKDITDNEKSLINTFNAPPFSRSGPRSYHSPA